MKLRDFMQEGGRKVVTPRDEKHYRELKKSVQDIQNNPKLRDPATKDEVERRKTELDAWAKKILKKKTWRLNLPSVHIVMAQASTVTKNVQCAVAEVLLLKTVYNPQT